MERETETEGRPGARPGEDETEKGRSGGCLLYLLAAGGWFFLLRDFASTPVAIALSAVGAALAYSGIYCTLGGLRHALAGPWYSVVALVGVILLAGAAATLLPAAPGDLLARAAPGWTLLESRLERVEQAVENGEVELARKLAGRGLGDPAARDGWGTPVLHAAKDGAMVAALLEAGLDPDAAGARGQTLLMRTRDLDVARALLSAGADPDVRDDHGFTALMFQRESGPAMLELLLEAGADVHAANDGGRTVADFFGPPERALLERHAGGRPLQETGGITPRGRDDWLAPARPGGSRIALEDSELLPGEVGTLSITIDNPAGQDRVLEVAALLDAGVLFVGASHGGALSVRRRPGPTSTVHWPWLSLPAGQKGHLELRVLARPDDAVQGLWVGDLGIRVEIVDLPERTESVLQFQQERAGPSAVVPPGDPRFWAGPLFIAAVAFAFWIVWRIRSRGDSSSQRDYRFGRMVAGAGALLCAAAAVSLGGSILEPWLRFDQSTCRVLDHRVLATEVPRDNTRRNQGGGSQLAPTMQGHPMAAVSIDTGGEPLVVAGWSAGQASRSVHELRAAPVGSSVPCWHDPDDPRRFSMSRTASAGGVVGLVMLLGVAITLGLIAAFLGRGAGKEQAGAQDDSREPPGA